MNFDEQMSAIAQQLQKELPGADAQYQMASDHRTQRAMRKMKPRDDVRVAGVLAMFYPKNNDIYLSLMERTDRGAHSGQVSFPGGGVEAQDADIVATALREAEEEVGIIPSDVQVMGRLTPLHIPVSNSMAYPIVGYSKTAPNYEIAPKEVKQVIEARLGDFFDPQKVKKIDLHLKNGLILKDTPYFDINGFVVWGATAMMINELLAVIRLATHLSA